MLLDRIAAFADRHAMFQAGRTIGVAVSGGADSVCLLHILRELAPRWNLRLHLLHLNHRLRGAESDGDVEFVRCLASDLSLPITIRDVEIAVIPGNLEQAARQARLEFFRDCIASGQVHRVALGHTRSDQAETVLFRFLRGAATAGLSGIRPATAAGIVRPLLEVDRSETEGYLRERGISWRDDSSNTDPRFVRNRIRHHLLPQLVREWNPALIETLAQTAVWAQAEEAYWEREIAALSSNLITGRNGAVFVKTRWLASLPAAVGRRMVRTAIEHAKGDLRGVGFAHVANILALAAGAAGHGRAEIPGVTVTRSFDWLRFVTPDGEQPAIEYRQTARVPGVFQIPGSNLGVSLELIENSGTFDGVNSVYNIRMGGLDWERLSGRLEFRNWQAGDRYQPSGSTGQTKLKTLFQRARIPLWERRLWPVLTDGGTIVWARRFGPAAEYEAKSGCRLVLAIHESESPDETGIGYD